MPTFRHGKNTVVLADQYDLSPYLNSLSATNEVDTLETTAFGAGARTYLTGHQNGTVSVEGMFDGTTDAVDEVFAAALTNDNGQKMTVGSEGTAVGSRAILLVAKETSYEVSSPLTEVVAVTGEVTADGGLAYGLLLTGRQSITGSLTGTSVDNTTATTNGFVAHLHVTANTRNGATTVKIQHSADNLTWVDLTTFTSVTASTVTSQRVTASGTVQRYLRAVATPGGTTGALTITVALARR